MNENAKIAIILLLKGLFYKADNEKAWAELVESSFGVIKEHFKVMGLDVMIDENEAYAYLQNRVYEDDETPLPKLVQSRELSYKVSLVCVLLRKKMADFDMQNENTKAVISAEDIKAEVLLFLAQKSNEIKRSIKAFVDASWLDDFNKRLEEYKKATIWN